MTNPPAKTATYTVWGVHRDNNQTWGDTITLPVGDQEPSSLEILDAMFQKFCIDNKRSQEDIDAYYEHCRRTPEQIQHDKIVDGIYPFIRFTDIFPGDVRAIWSSQYYED